MAKADRRGGGSGQGADPPSSRSPARRSLLRSLIYWTAVAGIWGAIALVIAVVVFAQGLPDTSKLYQIHRQPSISYLDRNGALLAVRGSQYAPPIDLETLPAYVPAAFVSIEDRRFYQHMGFDPIGMVRMVVVDTVRRSYAQGGSTINPATRAQPFPHAGPERTAQGSGVAVGCLARARIHQETDPGAVSESRLLRRGGLWYRIRGRDLLQQTGVPS